MRYYGVNLLIIDTFEDQEIDSELSTSEISGFIEKDLPFGLKIVKEEVRKLDENQFNQLKEVK
jgi:hypothetical protein